LLPGVAHPAAVGVGLGLRGLPGAVESDGEASVAVADGAVVLLVLAERSADVQEADLRLGNRARGGEFGDQCEQAVVEIGEVLGLPVVVPPLRLGVVQIGLELDVGLLLEQVHHRVAKRPDRREGLVFVVERAAVADRHGADQLALPLRRHEWGRRRAEDDEPGGQLAARLGRE